MKSHSTSPRLGRAATAGDEQMESHNEPEEQPPAEVPKVELDRRAGIMLSGETGAAVASGGDAVTTAPTYGLCKDVTALMDELERTRPALFDRHAEHRPCGLLDKYGAAGMLIADVHGLLLVPWELAEPIGKQASKLVKEIAGEVKKAKKAAKRRGTDVEAAAAAVLRRQVTLPLPSAGAIKAAVRRFAKAAHPPLPPPEPEPPAPELLPAPEPPPAPPLSPALELAMSKEAAAVIIAAYTVMHRSHPSRLALGHKLEHDDKLEHAQVSLKHGLRRLGEAYPDWSDWVWEEQSARDVVMWTVRVHATGHSIPAAVAAAQRTRFALEKCAADVAAEAEAQYPASGAETAAAAATV